MKLFSSRNHGILDALLPEEIKDGDKIVLSMTRKIKVEIFTRNHSKLLHSFTCSTSNKLEDIKLIIEEWYDIPCELQVLTYNGKEAHGNMSLIAFLRDFSAISRHHLKKLYYYFF